MAFDKPRILRMKFLSETNDETAQAYCKRVIHEDNKRQRENAALYRQCREFRVSQSQVISFSKCIESSKALEFYVIYFIITSRNSIYCFPEGSKAHLCVYHHTDNDFTNRALPCIATIKGNFDIKDLNGKQKTKLLKDFTQFESPPLEDNDDVITKVTTWVRENVYRIRTYLQMQDKGARLEATKKALTICKTLSLVDIVKLTEFFDMDMVEEKIYYIFCNDVMLENPTIRRMKFPREKEDETPEAFCQRIINEFDSHNNNRHIRSFGSPKIFNRLQCKIIVYSKRIDYETDASGLLAKKLTSQHDYVICFVLTERNSIYCVTKGDNAFKSIESHEDNNFVSKALRCIATEEVSLLRIQERYGMYTSRELRFRQPTIPPITDMIGVATKVHTWVHRNAHLNKSYLQVQLNGKRTGARITATRRALTICKKLKLTNIVSLIEHLELKITEEEGYYIFEYVNKVEEVQKKQELEEELEKSGKLVGENVVRQEGIYCKNSNGDWLQFHKAFHEMIKDAFASLSRFTFRSDDDKMTHLTKSWGDIEKNTYISMYHSPNEYFDSPSEYFDSPNEYSESSSEYSNSSNEYSDSPNEYSDSPSECSESPSEYSDSPNECYNSSKGYSDSSNEYSDSQSEDAESQSEDAESPSDFYNLQSDIQLYDLVKITDNTLLLYHVSEGLAQNVGKVCQQITRSARLIYAARYSESEENNHLLKLYNLIKAINGNEINTSFSNVALKRLFQKAFVYVLAFKDVRGRLLHDNLENSIEDVSTSDIAMHELLQTNVRLQQLGFELRLCQIQSKGANDRESCSDRDESDADGVVVQWMW